MRRRRTGKRRVRGRGLGFSVWRRYHRSLNSRSISVRTFDGRVALLPDEKLKHIANEHRDLMERLGIGSLDQLRALIIEALQNPSEVYEDAHGNIFHLLRRGDRTVCVIARGGRAQTAYLLGSQSYGKMARRRWITSASLRDLALKVIEAVEELSGEKLPRNIIRVSLHDDGLLFIRFRWPKDFDSGEPVYPSVILFRDGDGDTITALEVLDYKFVLDEIRKPPSERITAKLP